MPPKFRITLEATVAPSEDPEKVLAAAKNVIGTAALTAYMTPGLVRLETSEAGSLDTLHNQLRDRRIRTTARRQLEAGRTGSSTTVMVNRQAATAGVAALCDNAEESPMGPLILTIQSEKLDELVEWLTRY
jgi:hypothetical protein